MKNHAFTTWVRSLMVLLAVAIGASSYASTVFVKSTSGTPYVKVDSESWTAASQASETNWYYVDVTTGSTLQIASTGSGSNASPSIDFSSSADSYFVYASDGYGINITDAKTATEYAFFEITANWTDANAYFEVWDGSAVKLNCIGGTSSAPVYMYVKSSSFSGTLYVKRKNPSSNVSDDSGKWNEASVTYNKGHYYTYNGNWSDSFTDASSDYASITWPTKPTWYIRGNWDGSNTWSSAEAMTNSSGTTWTIQKTLTNGNGTVYFFLSYQNIGTNWHPRYGPTNSTGVDVSAGGTFSTTHYATSSDGDPSFYIPLRSIVTGTYTFSFDESTDELTVTKPEIAAKSATLYLYSTTEPRMSGVTFTQEANDNNDDTKDKLFYWYKGTYSSTTWSGNVSFTANGSTKTLALGTDLADGGTYYFDASNTTTTADYNPYASNTITVYVRKADFPNAKLHAWFTPVDESANVPINGSWQSNDQLMTDEETVNTYVWYKKVFTGYNEIHAMLSGGDKGQSEELVTGNSAFSGTLYYYIDGSDWVGSANPFHEITIHVIDKVKGTTPYYLYAWDGTNLNGAFPGNAMTTTETIHGETWYKQTFTTTASTITVNISENGDESWQCKDLPVTATAGDWYIVLDSWQTKNTDAACALSQATQPSTPQQHNSLWYIHGNLDRTKENDVAWVHDYTMTGVDGGNTTFTFRKQLLSGVNYYFFVSDVDSNDWDELNEDNHRYAPALGTTDISLNTTTAVSAQSGEATLHYYSESVGLHTFTYNAKDGTLTITREVVDPTSDDLYLIGIVKPEGSDVTNEWAANVGVLMNKGVDDDNVTYYYLNNVTLLGFNSGFGFASKLASDRDDWTYLNACRYGALISSGTQKVLHNEAIETDDNSDDSAQWHEMYEVGQSENTFTVETDGVYNIKVYKSHDGKAPTVHLYRSSFPDVMYIVGGKGEWSPTKGTLMTRDETATDEVYVCTVSLSIDYMLTFSSRLGDWTYINDNRVCSASPADGTDGYWITNNNLDSEISLTQFDTSWSDTDAAKHNFNIKTDKGGLFRVTLNKTQMTVKFELLYEDKGDKVYIYLEKTGSEDGTISNPLLYAYDKESWRDEDKENDDDEVHVDRPKFSVLIGTDPDYGNRHRLCLADGTQPRDYTSESDGRDWYMWEVNHSITEFIITKNGKLITAVTANADDTDTDDTDAINIQWRRSGDVYLHWTADGSVVDYTRDYDSSSATEAPTCTKMIDGHYYVYFINTMQWPESYIHAWFTNSSGVNEDLLGSYPGKQMTDLVGYDSNGNQVYLFDFGPISNFEGRAPTGILFNMGPNGSMQTGDFVFVNGAVYDYTGTVVLGRDLANIIATGVDDGETRYIIEDDIVAVYYDAINHELYCKDLNKFKTTQYVERSVQQDGQVDYVRDTTGRLNGQMESARYDQSNWVVLKVHSAEGSEYYTSDYYEDLATFARNRSVLKAGTVRGVLTDVKNPTMQIVKLDDGGTIEVGENSTYATTKAKTNVYTTANFVGDQEGKTSGRSYFFVTPKPNEYAWVTWAVCTAINGTTATFAVPENKYQGDGEYDNQDELSGGFSADLSLVDVTPAVGTAYTFPAIIKLRDDDVVPAPRRAPSSYSGGDTGTSKYDYVVYPLELSNVITGVTEVGNKTVAGVSYVNMAGMQSAEPFEGVNIVVTTYTDGTRTAVKMLK